MMKILTQKMLMGQGPKGIWLVYFEQFHGATGVPPVGAKRFVTSVRRHKGGILALKFHSGDLW